MNNIQNAPTCFYNFMLLSRADRTRGQSKMELERYLLHWLPWCFCVEISRSIMRRGNTSCTLALLLCLSSLYFLLFWGTQFRFIPLNIYDILVLITVYCGKLNGGECFWERTETQISKYPLNLFIKRKLNYISNMKKFFFFFPSYERQHMLSFLCIVKGVLNRCEMFYLVTIIIF